MDFDGDCRSDILWRNAATGSDVVYLMNGLAIVSAATIDTVADPAWQIQGVGDFDGDGKADILWRNVLTGDNFIYLMNGATPVAQTYVNTISDPSWQVQGVGDFNGDGKADILWRNLATGDNFIYLMDGTTITAKTYVNTVSDQAWQVKGIGDFDGDGKADIFWRNSVTGENYIYLMDGTTIVARGTLNFVTDMAWQVKGVGDFDGDGKADVLWRNSATGDVYVYLMNGLKSTTLTSGGYVTTVDDQTWQVRAIGDFDGDGKADILWRNNASGDDFIFFMTGVAVAANGALDTVADGYWMVKSASTLADTTGPDKTPPSTPAGLSASAASTTQINLSWRAATDNVGVTRYRVYRNGVQLASVSATSYADTGLQPATAYSYTVAAYDGAGNGSSQSAAASATTKATPDTQAPTAPTDVVAAAASASQIDVSWSAASDNVGVRGYRVYRDGALAASPTGTQVSITGLAPATPYSFSVAAVDAAGNVSALSAPVSAMTQPPGDTMPPSVPSGLSVSAVTPTSLTLAWNPSTDNVGVAGYRVYSNGALLASAAGPLLTLTGLTPSTLYSFTVAAFDTAGNSSAPSAALTLTTLAPPDVLAPTAPADLAATALTPNSLTLSWSAAVDNVGVSGYRVYRDGVLVATPSGTAATVAGLAAGTAYAFTVTAFDAAGNVSLASGALAITTPLPAPKPQILWSAGMETGNLAEWSEKVNSGSADSTAITAAAAGIPAHSGNWVLKQSVTGSSGGTRMIHYGEVDALADAGTTFYVSWWDYYPGKLSFSIYDMFSIFQICSRDSNGVYSPIWTLDFQPSGASLQLNWSPNNMAPSAGPHVGESGKRFYMSNVTVPIGQWVFFEVMITPAADFTGEIKVSMNGTVLFDQTQVKTRFPDGGVGGFMYVQHTAYGSGLNPTPYSHYIDDVTISLGSLYAP
jgi:chitodextrinase